MLLFGVFSFTSMKMTNIVLLLIALSVTISAQKYCTMSTSKLICTYDPAENQSLSIRKSDIKILDLSGRIFNEDIRSSLKDYSNLEELSLSSCRIKHLENRTFADLSQLIKLNLSDNLIASFNSFSVDKQNVLNILILSNNLLNSLDNIHLENFPKLKVLDISGNLLNYLPEEIMFRIQNDPTFSLYFDNNPWNCDNANWSKSFKIYEDMKKKFCYTSVNSKAAATEEKEETIICDSRTAHKRENCGFIKCKWWIIGSVWIGVILGNINKLNKLLYQCRCKKKTVFEKAVGTENEIHHLLRQERVALGVEESAMKSKN